MVVAVMIMTGSRSSVARRGSFSFRCHCPVMLRHSPGRSGPLVRVHQFARNSEGSDIHERTVTRITRLALPLSCWVVLVKLGDVFVRLGGRIATARGAVAVRVSRSRPRGCCTGVGRAEGFLQ